MNITEPMVDANSDEIVSKKSKLDLSPPATPPKRPAPEVRSCDFAQMINIIQRFPKLLNQKLKSRSCDGVI